MWFKIGRFILVTFSFLAFGWGIVELINPASQITIESIPPILPEQNSPALEAFQSCGVYAVIFGVISLILLFSSLFRQRHKLVWKILLIFIVGGWGGEWMTCLYYGDTSARYLLIGFIFSCVGLGLMTPQFFVQKTATAVAQPTTLPLGTN